MDVILRLRNIRHHYNGRTVLDVPALDIRRGFIIGLAGPNGSGKTTLLKIMALIQKSASGMVYFHGKATDQMHAEEKWRVALLPQEPYLLKRTVFNNIAYGLKIRGRTNDLAAAVHTALDLVGLPQAFAQRYWHELSGGERQRVALAARLVLQPDCLLLDEPTASVDMDSETRIRQAILAARREQGTTLIIASHQRAWLNDICDKLIFLYNGRIIEGGAENILLGPWERLEGGGFGKQLSDGQCIYVSTPPRPESTAMIDPGYLVLVPDEDVDNFQVLHGTVTAVFFEKQAPGPRVHVMCGDQRFIAGVLEEDKFRLDSCRPGTQVVLRYRPEHITWLPT
jgi:tungstate transport system ATP-binding protein